MRGRKEKSKCSKMMQRRERWPMKGKSGLTPRSTYLTWDFLFLLRGLHPSSFLRLLHHYRTDYPSVYDPHWPSRKKHSIIPKNRSLSFNPSRKSIWLNWASNAFKSNLHNVNNLNFVLLCIAFLNES